jgi:2-isopropylmalate synthase
MLGVETGINMSEIVRTSRLVSSQMGIPIQPNKAIVGVNAFAHSSGVHQDGVLKDRRNFEIVRPEDVGSTEHRLVLTARSGRKALVHRLGELGFTVERDQVDSIYGQFLALADKKKEVDDEDLYGIMEDLLQEVEEQFSLESFRIDYDENGTPIVKVSVREGEAVHEATSSGDGPVDAAYHAVDKVTKTRGDVLDYHLRARTSGREAVGEATVKAKFGDLIVIGKANDTDIIRASIDAYLNAVNRALGRQA